MSETAKPEKMYPQPNTYAQRQCAGNAYSQYLLDVIACSELPQAERADCYAAAWELYEETFNDCFGIA